MTTLETGIQIRDKDEEVGGRYKIQEVVCIPKALNEVNPTEVYAMPHHAECGGSTPRVSAHSVVFVAADKVRGREVAIKAYAGNHESQDGRTADNRLKAEQKVHRLMSQRAGGLVVPLLNVASLQLLSGDVHTSQALITEWSPKGTYEGFVCASREDVREVLDMTMRTASALAILGAQGYVHGDVFEGNIARGVSGARLMDFGSVVVAGQQYDRVEGRPGYVSDEVLETGISTHKRDIFGLSVVAFSLLTGKIPYSRNDTDPFLSNQVATPIRDLDEKLHMLPAEAIDMYRRGLSPDPEVRPHGREMARLAHVALESL